MILKRNENSEAVSPVVGVMLMLVVTIIIAAVVSGFAGGLAGETKKAPSTVLDVHIYNLINSGAMPPWGDGYYTSEMTIESISGDTLPTSDLEIRTYYTNNSGTTKMGCLNSEQYVNGTSEWNYFGTDQYCGVLYLNDQNRFGSSSAKVTSSGGNTGSAPWFGNESAVLMPGDILITPAHFCGNYNDNDGPSNPHSNPAIEILLGFDPVDDKDGFAKGKSVKVNIIHKPSGATVYNKEVFVE